MQIFSILIYLKPRINNFLPKLTLYEIERKIDLAYASKILNILT